MLLDRCTAGSDWWMIAQVRTSSDVLVHRSRPAGALAWAYARLSPS
ncbi:hypothetical protein [Nonomuraea sp. B19D2]